MSRVVKQKITIDELADKIYSALKQVMSPTEFAYIAERADEYKNNFGKGPSCKDAKEIITRAIHECELYRIPTVEQDLKKVEFDWENTDAEGDHRGTENAVGFRYLPNGLAFLGVSAGGDWEIPVFFMIYWDGTDLRAYIPKEGNPWNRSTKQAYGNDEDEDLKDMKKHFGVDDPDDVEADTSKIMEDCIKRIEVAA